jgi:hypothetical protein
MPGFAIGNLDTAENKDHKAEFRRKHRWRVALGSNDSMEDKDFLYLKSAARPNFKYLEAEVHHDQEKAFFAGKQEWDPIELVFYDAVSGRGVNDISQHIYEWVNDVVDIEQATASTPDFYKKTLDIQMVGADGEIDERWTLFGCWPVSSNWNNLDYTANEIQEVTVSLRFDRAHKVE